ncbi:DUF885 domain-containing protein [Salinibacterium sp. UTAS2018]|uniref:DUF885 domain-containing protein n=1 Tax=Salinibacterium sp. UTAS2018 TaxID=2508880 RepID=UPI0010095F93|nr:DUF885 domain-containing protein [Salinibacterium sp. UTAS2018]QAV69460.1 DUF885 domain-containing protein [Salinibacterium sp. UTAS2018]
MSDTNASPAVAEPSPRESTPIDAIAEKWVEKLVELNPAIGTYIGSPGQHSGYADYSPGGHARVVAATREVLAQLEAAPIVDDVDVVTRAEMVSTLTLDLESDTAELWKRDLNNLASPAQDIRGVLDLMPTATEADWSVIADRLHNIPEAIDGYIATLRHGIEGSVVPAQRQVAEVIAQARQISTPGGFFDSFIAQSELVGGGRSLGSALSAGAAAAASSYQKLEHFLVEELAPNATTQDAFGRDLYALQSQSFLGAKIDLDETYEWGIEELARMTAEQQEIAHEIKPGASIAEAIEILDADPSRTLHGTEALQQWMQKLSDEAIEALAGTHFDIAEPMRALECMIAPTHDGIIYYTGPSDDFSRPGRMWWSVPESVTEFTTWREATTVYHEGVPGHHLQIAQAVYNRDQLNTYRRQLAGSSGHAEGWALYAERLMSDLGFLDDPANRLGMLDGQRMRAARVVLDIGVHLGKPKLTGSGVWDWEYALDFMTNNVTMDQASVRFEVNRYFGWPGQAPSYKVGQRIWEQLRDECREHEGAGFDLKEFHRRALNVGGVGLDTLRTALLAPYSAS